MSLGGIPSARGIKARVGSSFGADLDMVGGIANLEMCSGLYQRWDLLPRCMWSFFFGYPIPPAGCGI
jgi:hypothetical protein